MIAVTALAALLAVVSAAASLRAADRGQETVVALAVYEIEDGRILRVHYFPAE